MSEEESLKDDLKKGWEDLVPILSLVVPPPVSKDSPELMKKKLMGFFRESQKNGENLKEKILE